LERWKASRRRGRSNTREHPLNKRPFRSLSLFGGVPLPDPSVFLNHGTEGFIAFLVAALLWSQTKRDAALIKILDRTATASERVFEKLAALDQRLTDGGFGQNKK
jgi:hypothetical protein